MKGVSPVLPAVAGIVAFAVAAGLIVSGLTAAAVGIISPPGPPSGPRVSSSPLPVPSSSRGHPRPHPSTPGGHTGSPSSSYQLGGDGGGSPPPPAFPVPTAQPVPTSLPTLPLPAPGPTVTGKCLKPPLPRVCASPPRLPTPKLPTLKPSPP